MQIDIRDVSKEIDEIRFFDDELTVLSKGIVNKGKASESQAVCVYDEYANAVGFIISKQHALNMIAALRKAIELEWLK